MKGRKLKQRVLDLLRSKDINHALGELCAIPARRVINPLFSFLYSTDEEVKWRAVTAMGQVVARLADRDMEQGRVVLRRLMWNLNDESGGIGWGSPEAMGEILACHEALADEFAPILISYGRQDGNYLELETLQRGLVWGVSRLARARPELVRDEAVHFLPFLRSADPALRGLGARLMGLVGAEIAREDLDGLLDDSTGITVYLNGMLITRSVKDLAKDALSRLPPKSP